MSLEEHRRQERRGSRGMAAAVWTNNIPLARTCSRQAPGVQQPPDSSGIERRFKQQEFIPRQIQLGLHG